MNPVTPASNQVAGAAALGWNEVFNPRQAAGGDSILPFLGIAHALASHAAIIAEIGCGRGSEAYTDRPPGVAPIQDLRGAGRRVTGLDVDGAGADNPMIDEFRLIPESGRWPLEDASVDLAVSDWVLEHVADPGTFVAELKRVLRPGGAFVARTPSRFSPMSFAARRVANENHSRVLSVLQPRREARDVFPTAYLMNSERALADLFGTAFDLVVAHNSDLRQYFLRWPKLARAIAATEPHLPKALRSTLVVYARKR